MVEDQYTPGSLVRVLQHTHPYGVPSKLNLKFSGLGKCLEIRCPTVTLRQLDTDKVFTTSLDAVRASTLSRPEVPLQAEPPADLPNTQNAESSAKDLAIVRVENLRLFADVDWLPPSATRAPSLTDLDLTQPLAISTPQSQTHVTARPQRNTRPPARFASSQWSASSPPLLSSVIPAPLSQPLAPAVNAASPRLSRAENQESEPRRHLVQVQKRARVPVLITCGAIITSSYGGYLVTSSIRSLLNSKPTPPLIANCCIVACRGSQWQTPRIARNEPLVKCCSVSARKDSCVLGVQQTAENESTRGVCHSCFAQNATRRTAARALDIPAVKVPESYAVARVYVSWAEPPTTAANCTRDTAVSSTSPRVYLYSALDCTSA